MDKHNEAIIKVAQRVKQFHAQDKPFRIYHGNTNTTRRATRSHDSAIDISHLNSVLSIRPDSNTALVEPNVPMDTLVKETLQHGLVPPVVMEFPGITCGGAFAGTGGESSSFRWGTFDRIVNGVEIVLGDGEIVWASEDNERSDLFNASAGAFGTLGVVTLLELRLVPAKARLVRLHYLFRYDRGAFWCARHSFDYLGLPFNSFTRWLLDGLMHTRDLFNMLHTTGTMINSIIQDLCIPARNVERFVSYTTLEFGLWPLWLCTIKLNAGRGIFQLSPSPPQDYETQQDATEDKDLWINVGLWGRAPPSIEKAVAANKRLEELGGYKWLYGQTFYTEEQFWNIYSKAEYDALRIKYRATSLPSAYDKVKTEVQTEKEKASSGWSSNLAVRGCHWVFWGHLWSRQRWIR